MLGAHLRKWSYIVIFTTNSMGERSRYWFMVAGLFMLGIGYWASTFASVLIDENRPLMFTIFLLGACLITAHAVLSAISHGNLEKRIAALEGNPETPPKPVK
jgi:hypothetical protein